MSTSYYVVNLVLRYLLDMLSSVDATGFRSGSHYFLMQVTLTNSINLGSLLINLKKTYFNVQT